MKYASQAQIAEALRRAKRILAKQQNQTVLLVRSVRAPNTAPGLPRFLKLPKIPKPS